MGPGQKPLGAGRVGLWCVDVCSRGRPKTFDVFCPSRKVRTASCCLGGLVKPLFCKSLGRTGLADVSGQMISRSNQSRNWLATKVANSPVSKTRIIMAYGIQLPLKSVTFVPHFGHTNDRRASLRSTSQCHVSKTRKRGRAFLNASSAESVGDFRLW